MFRRSSHSLKQGTFIAPGTQLEGTICCEANIRIDGKFTGKLECSGTITIGKCGEIQSSLCANHIIVAGTVIGDLHATGKLTITSTGQVFGNCLCEVLRIEEGGLLNGSSFMDRTSNSGASNDRSKGSKVGSSYAEEEKRGSEKQMG